MDQTEIVTSDNMPKGIRYKDTSRHGFWIVTPQRLAAMPEALKTPSDFYDGGQSFEEDLEYNRVILAFPDEFPPSWVETAHWVMKNYHPDIYEAFTGEEIPLEESRVKRERVFYEAHKDDYLVLSASGSWHKNVPEGYVGVIAGRGGIVKDGNGERYPDDVKEFMVTKERYRQGRGGLPYVINLEVDEEANWSGQSWKIYQNP